MGIDDILAAIGKFQGSDNAPTTWLDVAPATGDGTPDFMVNVGDVLAIIGGFQGDTFPGIGPLGCP